MAQLQGEATLVSAPHRISNGTLRVRLVDVSRADAPAIVIAEETIRHVNVESGSERFAFVLEIPLLDPSHTFALEAHLDASGSGETSIGDYRTMEHIGVSGTERIVSVPLRPVG